MVPVDNTIESYVRGKKQPYKEVQYKDDVYEPPVYQDPAPILRRSTRLAGQTEQWTDHLNTIRTSAKSRKALKVNGRSIIVPSCIQAVPSKGMIDQPLKINDTVPLDTDPISERLRAYHARLDLLQAMLHPEQADHE